MLNVNILEGWHSWVIFSSCAFFFIVFKCIENIIFVIMANIALNNLALITQEDTHNIVKNKDPKKDSQCENTPTCVPRIHVEAKCSAR